jgi:Leucine-rich repeat (LRR) protein
VVDVMQIIAEFLSGNIAEFMSLRCVSYGFMTGVSDAVGFLNNRCWTEFDARDSADSGKADLWVSLRRRDDICAANRCALVCLRHRLETLRWYTETSSTRRDHLRLDRLKGASKLKVLKIDARTIARRLSGPRATRFDVLLALESLELTAVAGVGLHGLRGCSALRELRLEAAEITAASFAGLQDVLVRLKKLDLSGCARLESVIHLAGCASLEELNLSYTGVADLSGLEQLLALATLDLRGTEPRNVELLQLCTGLRALSADWNCRVPMDVLQRCATHLALTQNAEETWGAYLVQVGRCAELRHLDLTATETRDVSVVAGIPTLEVLLLDDTRVEDVSSLRTASHLRELHLHATPVSNIAGLEDIPTLQTLNLSQCVRVTRFANLSTCQKLRVLELGETSVTDVGIREFASIPELARLVLRGCVGITTVACLKRCPHLTELDIATTQVTDAGILGLEAISTLTTLDMSSCPLNDVSSLENNRALRTVILRKTAVRDDSVTALGTIASLTSLNLSRCKNIRNINGLRGLPRLATLMLSGTPISDVTALLRCPLRQLIVPGTRLTDAGVAGVENWDKLVFLDVCNCPELLNLGAFYERCKRKDVTIWADVRRPDQS